MSTWAKPRSLLSQCQFINVVRYNIAPISYLWLPFYPLFMVYKKIINIFYGYLLIKEDRVEVV